MEHVSTEKMPSDRSMTIKLYSAILIVLASIDVMFLIGNFGMGVLSSLRAFVNVEYNLSNGSKGAAFQLMRYIQTHNDESYKEFLAHIGIAWEARTARIELEKLQPDLFGRLRSF